MLVLARLMAIEARTNMALLTEGEHASTRAYKHFPPDGGRARFDTRPINISLLTEGERASTRAYEHFPPTVRRPCEFKHRA